MTNHQPGRLSETTGSGVLDGAREQARLKVLRITALIALMIATNNLVGSIVGWTASGHVTGPAAALAVGWCTLWALAAAFPRATARVFASWRATALILGAANAATVAVTGGIESPLLAVCIYAGWISSVVVEGLSPLVTSLVISGSLIAGYVLGGDSIADVLSGRHRHTALASAMLPILVGVVGVCVTTVANMTLTRLAKTLDELRGGAPATTPAMTALLAGGRMLELPAGDANAPDVRANAVLTAAERHVVSLLADGHRPQQIARLRGVAVSTIRSQIKAAKQKTGARTINELVVVAWDEGP
jgi:DNA-binding CsgD family transcriptional regulator